MRIIARVLLVLLLIIPCLATAGKVNEYQLDNGLRLFVKENHRAPVVVSQVWYKVGSSYEPNGITGVSHVLEHMMYGGTRRVGPNVLSRTIAANGGQDNALTYFDYTTYFQTLAADKLPLSFELEADRMQNLQFNESFFKKELQVVIEEWRMRTKDNPPTLAYARFLAAAHVSNPYHHLPIGWISDLENMRVQDVKQWYQQWYAPNNAIVVVVGDVVPDDVYRLAKRYFGPLKRRELPVLKPRREVVPLGARTVAVDIPAKLPVLYMGYNVPVLNTAKQADEPYALTVAAAILGMDNSARLPRNVVRKQQIASSVDVAYDPFRRVDTLFVLTGVPVQGRSMSALKEAFFAEVKRLQDTNVTASELARVKTQVIASKVYSRDSLMNQAQEIGALESVGISWRVGDAFDRHIAAVTPAEIRAAARKYLTSKRLTVGVLKPLPFPKNVQKKS